MAVKPTATRRETASAANDSGKTLQGLPGCFSGPGAEDLNRLLHERVRLGIMSALLVNQTISFAELKTLLNTSDGNLSGHARRLENAEYIRCKKSFVGRLPKTEYCLTSKGRKAFERYLEHMEALLRLARRELIQ